MAHTSINFTHMKDFIGEQKAPFLFHSPVIPKTRFALALASPGEKPVENIRVQILRLMPCARIFELTSPPGRDLSKQYREFLSEAFYHLGELPFRHGQESAIAARLPRLLSSRFDFVIIDHAETMGEYSLDALRGDRGCPPAILVAYDDRILETIIANEVLLN